MRRTPLAVLIPIVAVLGTACSDASTPTSPNASAANAPNLGKIVVVPPAIDGVMSPGEWDGAATIPFRLYVPGPAGAVPATAYVTHDKASLYLAVTFDRMSPFHPNDFLAFEFDNDNDGIREDGDDILLTFASLPQNVPGAGGDYYRFNGGFDNKSDQLDGGTNDVVTAWGALGTKGVFEIRHPLKSGDAAHDLSIDPSISAVTVGMEVSASLEADPVGSLVTVPTYYPSLTTYCRLTLTKKATSVTCP